MEKVYLFGAGINCYGVIKFIGKENIIAVVDNSERKIGFEIEGIEIISFSDFLLRYCKETVIISAYYARHEIKKQLNECGIVNCVAAPYMQKGYYKSYQDFVDDYAVNRMESVYIYGENYFSKNLINVLKDDIKIYFVRDAEYQETKFQGFPIVDLALVPHEANIILAIEQYRVGDEQLLDKSESKFNIINMYELKRKKHLGLKKFEKLYQGKRCFIIGNGPSLMVKDLDILEQNNEICFGSNWIIKMFEKTKWRPDFYTVVDYNFMRHMPRNMENSKGEKVIIFRADVFSGDMEEKDNIYTYQAIPYQEKKIMFSKDIVDGIYGSLTVTYDMIQIAAYMGFQEIYLLGVDCSNGSKHFYSSDEIDNNKLENRTVLNDNGWNQQYAAWIDGYRKAEEYSRSNGFRIYNATRGGALEVFERVDFDSLFKHEE